MNNTSTMVRRQNSFGRDLCDGGVGVGSGGARLLPSNNPTPTFCTLPRDSKACEDPPPSAFVPINSNRCNGTILKPGSGECSLQVTYGATPTRFTSATPSLVQCSNNRCTVANCPGVDQALDISQPGFNSSCQQCLAERAEMVGDLETAAACKMTAETSFSPDTNNGDRYSPNTEHSLSTSVLSTKNLVDTCDNDLETRGSRVSNPSPGRTYECEDVCRKSMMLIFSTLGMTVITFGYIVLGALIFSAIESGHQASLMDVKGNSPTVMTSNEMLATLSTEVNSYIDTLRGHTVTKLWEMTEQMNILYPVNWTHNAAEELLNFQRMLSSKLAAEIMSRPIYPNAKPSASGTFQFSAAADGRPHQDEWGFSRGFLYSLSLLTTIGSGCDGTISALGCVISIIYVIIGVPLMFIYLLRIGGLLANLVTCFCCSVDQRPRSRSYSSNSYYSCSAEQGGGSSVIHQGHVRQTKEPDKIIMTPVTPDQSIRGLDSSWSVVQGSGATHAQYSAPAARPNVVGPLVVIIMLVLSYISSSAAILAKLHSWTFVESFHFCFMSIFTVSTGAARLDQSNVAACVIYIFFGLILVSTCSHILYYEVILKISVYKQLTSSRHGDKSGKLGNGHAAGSGGGKRNSMFS